MDARDCPWTPADQERFWLKVRETSSPTECWVWEAGRYSGGYGSFWLAGRSRQAHVCAWLFTQGPIPADQWVLHHCDNPPCVNPTHLYLGSMADNATDRVVRGRAPRGERHGRAKLSALVVHEIKSRHTAGELRSKIAEDLGVAWPTVASVLNGRTWRHVA